MCVINFAELCSIVCVRGMTKRTPQPLGKTSWKEIENVDIKNDKRDLLPMRTQIAKMPKLVPVVGVLCWIYTKHAIFLNSNEKGRMNAWIVFIVLKWTMSKCLEKYWQYVFHHRHHNGHAVWNDENLNTFLTIFLATKSSSNWQMRMMIYFESVCLFHIVLISNGKMKPFSILQNG